MIAELGTKPVDQIDFNQVRGLIKVEQGKRQAARAAAKANEASETVLKAKSKAPARAQARPSSAPVYDLSSGRSQRRTVRRSTGGTFFCAGCCGDRRRSKR